MQRHEWAEDISEVDATDIFTPSHMVVDVTKLEAEVKSFLFIGHGDPLIKGSRIIYYILIARLS